MRYDINPFQELYFSDDLLEDEFVGLFSPKPVQSAIHPLFQNGNVVLSGTQGCGKTMLLRLLLPETRIAYFDAKIPFPISQELTQFISAGISLIRSGIADIAGITLGKGVEYDFDQLPFYFADFFNFLVLQDILKTIRQVGERSDVFGDICKLDKENTFFECLVKQNCWNGSLDNCKSFELFKKTIENRIAIYRRWISYNELSPESRRELAENKTSIGEPIARTIDCLRKSGLLKSNTKVFIRVDQLEELHQQSPEPRQHRLRLAFRRMFNRALASRDSRVHYRIGTRRYGWNQPELFLRKESSSDWLFAEFARDAFARRVAYSLQISALSRREDLADSIFGKSPKPSQLARYIVKSNNNSDRIDTVLGLSETSVKDVNWSEAWRNWLIEIYKKDPLVAILAAAWGRQTGGTGKPQHRELPPPLDDKWLKKWWRKERLALGVLQLAARRSQRMLWWGFEDIISLSGGNITVFLHICHKIWDLFLKSENLKGSEKIDIINSGQIIPQEIQSIGIQTASTSWYEKIGEQPAGDVRRRFVDKLGKTLRRHLRDDLAMSYPGANGVSIAVHEFEQLEHHKLWDFLCDAVGYGDLQIFPHTTKNKAGEARKKFYLNPVLSPHFQLPAAHTKEPLYWKAYQLIDIARKAQLPFVIEDKLQPLPIQTSVDNPAQLNLFK